MSNRSKTVLSERSGVIGKECSKCNEWKALEEYHNAKNGLGGRYSKCKVCKNLYTEKNYKKNSDSRKENRKQRYKENREKEIAQSTKYNNENKEAVTKRLKKWKQENKDIVATHFHKRRAMKKSLPDTWTTTEQKYALAHFKGCALTGSLENIVYDHVIPLSIGHGGTIKENMIPLRADLNGSKLNKNLFEWYAQNRERFKLSEDKFKALVEYLARLNNMTPEEYREYVYECYSVRA